MLLALGAHGVVARRISFARALNQGRMAAWMPMALPSASTARRAGPSVALASMALPVDIRLVTAVDSAISFVRRTPLASTLETVAVARLTWPDGAAPSTVGCGSSSGPAVNALAMAPAGAVTRPPSPPTICLTCWTAACMRDICSCWCGCAAVAIWPVSISPAAAVAGIAACLAKNSGTACVSSTAGRSAGANSRAARNASAFGTSIVAVDCRTAITAPITAPAVPDTARPRLI